MKKSVLLNSIILGGLTLAIMQACNQTQSKSAVNQVIGQDNRSTVYDPDLAKKLGILNTGNTSCQAYLGSMDRITTAAHCVANDPYSFVGFKFTTKSGKTANVTDLVFLDGTKDIVSYKLDRQFDSYLSQEKLDIKQPLAIVAWDQKSDSLKKSVCEVKKKLSDNAAFSYSCDTEPGYSGGAVLQGGKVVGVHVGYAKSLNANIAVDLSLLNDDSKDIRALSGLTAEWGPHMRMPDVHTRIPDVELPKIPDGGFSDYLKEVKDTLSSSVADLVTKTGIPDFKIANPSECSGDVVVTTGAAMLCGGCIAGSTASAGATSVACAKPCSVTSGALYEMFHDKCI